MEIKSSKNATSKDKGVFQKAGEMIEGVGHQIVEGKDKVLDAVSGEFQVIKKVIVKKFAKKKTTPVKSKKVELKRSSKKTITNASGKTTGKAVPKRGLRKFDSKAKKAAKKSSSNRMKK